MAGPRIFRTIVKYNVQIRRTNSYLIEGAPNPLNWERIGLLQSDVNAWAAFLARWIPLMTKYQDKKVTRTTDVTIQLHLVIADCVLFDKNNHFLDRIASSLTATATDLEVFNIKKGVLQDTVPSQSHTQLKDVVDASLLTKIGANIKIGCKTSHATSRPGKPKGANCVRYAYKIGTTAPSGAEEAGMIVNASTKASFLLKLGTANAGKNLYIYFQWYNYKHPEIAGDWSVMYTEPII